jgi:hypothetical protein
VLRKAKRMLTKTEKRGKFLIFTGHNVLNPWGRVVLEFLCHSNQNAGTSTFIPMFITTYEIWVAVYNFVT